MQTQTWQSGISPPRFTHGVLVNWYIKFDHLTRRIYVQSIWVQIDSSWRQFYFLIEAYFKKLTKCLTLSGHSSDKRYIRLHFTGRRLRKYSYKNSGYTDPNWIIQCHLHSYHGYSSSEQIWQAWPNSTLCCFNIWSDWTKALFWFSEAPHLLWWRQFILLSTQRPQKTWRESSTSSEDGISKRLTIPKSELTAALPYTKLIKQVPATLISDWITLLICRWTHN